MATFLIAHGAWSAGWSWKKMRSSLGDLGHELISPTYTGVGERMHLADREVNLETHIADILNVFRFEDLHDIILVGHSYGGMVATAVADRIPDCLRHLVYLDAFVPRDGQSLMDLHSTDARGETFAAVQQQGDGWLVPPNPLPPDTNDRDVAWITPRRVMQPVKTMTQALNLSGAVHQIPKTYVYCTRTGANDPFRPFAQRARRESGWRYVEIDASHSPQITAPEILAAVFDAIAKK